MSFTRGDTVNVQIYRPGTGLDLAGTVRGIVLHAGTEYDVLVHPEADLEELEYALRHEDLTAEDCREGAVYVLRNCQPEQVIHA